jgi:quercetin dioxygenase-like cupin family protein
MLKVDLNKLELNEFAAKNNNVQRCKATFPMFAAHGTKESATVYFELNPGDELGTHTDSAEELLLIMEGSVEAMVGNAKTEASQGNLLLVPKMIPHNFKNTGNRKAKVLGFFGGANNIVATFENVWLPTESNIVDTSLMIQEESGLK